jgi:hypothetical protein
MNPPPENAEPERTGRRRLLTIVRVAALTVGAAARSGWCCRPTAWRDWHC